MVFTLMEAVGLVAFEEWPAKASDLCISVLTSNHHRIERLIFIGANKKGAHGAAHIEGALAGGREGSRFHVLFPCLNYQ